MHNTPLALHPPHDFQYRGRLAGARDAADVEALAAACSAAAGGPTNRWPTHNSCAWAGNEPLRRQPLCWEEGTTAACAHSAAAQQRTFRQDLTNEIGNLPPLGVAARQRSRHGRKRQQAACLHSRKKGGRGGCLKLIHNFITTACCRLQKKTPRAAGVPPCRVRYLGAAACARAAAHQTPPLAPAPPRRPPCIG